MAYRDLQNSQPVHCLAGGLPPAHDPMANVRTTVLPARTALGVPSLLSAHEMGGRTVGTSRLDGTPRHADASKSRALRAKRRRARDRPRRTEVDTWCARTAHAEQPERPAGWVIAHARALRHARLANLAQAPAV